AAGATVDTVDPVATVVVAVPAAAAGTAGAYLLVRRAVAAARRRYELARVRVLALGTGPRCRAARMHRALLAEVAATVEAVRKGREAGWPLGDSPALSSRLVGFAGPLAEELRLLT